MKHSLTNGLDVDAKSDLEGTFIAALLLRKRLAVVLAKKIEDARAGSVKKEKYDCANWAYLQANNVGYERAMRELIEMMEIK